LPQSFAQFGKLLRSEDEERDSKDDEQMLGLQQTFNHGLEKLLTIFTIVRDAGRLRIGYASWLGVPSTVYDGGMGGHIRRVHHDRR
jgi:hypothetical protein